MFAHVVLLKCSPAILCELQAIGKGAFDGDIGAGCSRCGFKCRLIFERVRERAMADSLRVFALSQVYLAAGKPGAPAEAAG